ncbi:MAG: tetratricopeptide repeat protein, partial [Chloroflexi bacterium]|nr:tetratricopeptide repeat protein [Chloroflexota bacterium]
EQALFARLAVFAGGCTLEAAEAVCDVEGDLGIDVLDGVTSLVEKSLLLVAEGGGEPRFRMLETVREHALEQLAARGEADRVRRRHAEAYLRLAEEAERDSSTPDRPAWMARLEGENDNLRAALTWSLEREGTGELALRLAGALAWFWSKRLDLNEGRRWLEQCLRLSTATGVTQRLPRAWARVLTGIADLAHTQGDFATALTYAEQAVTVWRPLDDKGGLARGLRMLAWLAQRQGDHARERALLDELVGLSRDEGRADLTTQALFAMARADLYLGNLAAARVRLEETLELSRKTGHLPSLARVLCMLAEIAWFQGDTAARCRFYEAGLACTSSLTDPMELSSHLARLAWVARRVGDYEQAETLVRQRLAVARGQMGPADAWWLVAWSLNHLGDVARCRDDVGRAASLYEESLTLFRQHGDRQGIAAVLHNQGRVALAQGDAGRARALFLESLSLFRQLNFVWSVADCLMGLAGVAGQEGRPERAALLFGAAAAAHEAIDASGALVEPANQLAWEREMRAARDELDTKAWEGAWSAGRAMSIDQALACEDLPALPPRV